MSKEWQMGCQYGNHGEPFLWYGSGDDDVDIAIAYLINLARDNPKLAHEACEFIDACVADARRAALAAAGELRPAPAEDGEQR